MQPDFDADVLADQVTHGEPRLLAPISLDHFNPGLIANPQAVTKDWGSSVMLYDSGIMSIHRISIVAGGFCSLHLHRTRWNAFAVFKGSLRVETRDGRKRTRHLLEAGAVIAVPPMVRHCFRTSEACEAMEWYWPGEQSTDDIVRFSRSGVSTISES